MNEANEMHYPEKGKFEYNLNTWVTLGGVICVMLVTSAGWGITYANMRNDNARLQDQIADVNTRILQESSDRKDLLKGYQETLNSMQKDIAQIQPLSFQTTRALEAATENKKGVEVVNDRIDRVVGSLGGKLDVLVETVNKVSTQVQVLNSKFEDVQGRSDKTLFRMPIVRP